MKEGIRIGKWNIAWKYVVLTGIFLVGSLVRLVALDRNPMGLHQDEAYSAYNAWAVMNYGTDSYGYTRPVYYTVWGSGMSVLYSYFTMPFLAILGVGVWAIRLPQAILGSISILVAYGLGKEIRNEKSGLAIAGMLAINPWHIQQSRFGLDANLAVPMLLLGIYFLCRYLKGKRNSIWGTAIFMGLTLYCYALTWILVPAILILTVILFREKIRWNKSFFGAVFVLFLLALPLLLFLAVNLELIPEICSNFISIPKLPAIRTGEMSISFASLKRRFFWLLAMLWNQHDDMWWISNSAVGSYYYISTPFIILGIIAHVRECIGTIKDSKRIPLHFIMFIWLLLAFLMGCCIDLAKFHKVNFLHIPIIVYATWGIQCLCRICKNRMWVKCSAVGVYAIVFCVFVYTHATFPVDYMQYGNSQKSRMHWNQYEEAIDRAEELTSGEIGVVSLNHANLMLYKQIPPVDFMNQVVYTGEEAAFLSVARIGRYRFDVSPGAENSEIVFVYPYSMEDSFIEQGYTTEHVTDCYGVAYKEMEE